MNGVWTFCPWETRKKWSKDLKQDLKDELSVKFSPVIAMLVLKYGLVYKVCQTVSVSVFHRFDWSNGSNLSLGHSALRNCVKFNVKCVLYLSFSMCHHNCASSKLSLKPFIRLIRTNKREKIKISLKNVQASNWKE